MDSCCSYLLPYSQSIQQSVQDNAHAIGCLVKFCVDVNIGTIENSTYLLKSMICNMQYIDKQQLYAKLFGEQSYVNWELSETMLKRSMAKRKTNSIGGIGVWFYLALYIEGKQEVFHQLTTSATRTMYRPFYLVVEACNSEIHGIQLDFSLLVRLFLTIHLIGIQPVHAISTILNTIVSKHTMQISASYAQNIALKILEEKFPPEQYIDTMLWLVKSRIAWENSALLQKEVEFHHDRERKNANIMKMKTIQVTKTSRPSLISLAKHRKSVHFGMQQVPKSVPSAGGGGGVVDAATLAKHNTFDGYFTFDGFKQFMKFPSNFSSLMQQRAYWLVSQYAFDWKLYVSDFLPHDLCAPLIEYGSITSPDDQVLVEVLESTNLVGAPFHALKVFQNTCLASFPVLERSGLTMNETLRLYIASYQQKTIWKNIWKSIKPLLSIQIIKDVEHFTSTNKMDHSSVISILLYGTSVPPHNCNFQAKIHENITAQTSSSAASLQKTPSALHDDAWAIADLVESRKQATQLAAKTALVRQHAKRAYKYHVVERTTPNNTDCLEDPEKKKPFQSSKFASLYISHAVLHISCVYLMWSHSYLMWSHSYLMWSHSCGVLTCILLNSSRNHAEHGHHYSSRSRSRHKCLSREGRRKLYRILRNLRQKCRRNAGLDVLKFITSVWKIPM